MSSKEWRREYYARNRDKLRAYKRARYHADPEKMHARNQAWKRANPEKVRAYNRSYRVRRLNKNPEPICIRCGEKFDYAGRGRPRKKCPKCEKVLRVQL